MRFPPFDDEEPPLDYADNILDVEPLEVNHPPTHPPTYLPTYPPTHPPISSPCFSSINLAVCTHPPTHPPTRRSTWTSTRKTTPLCTIGSMTVSLSSIPRVSTAPPTGAGKWVGGWMSCVYTAEKVEEIEAVRMRY